MLCMGRGRERGGEKNCLFECQNQSFGSSIQQRKETGFTTKSLYFLASQSFSLTNVLSCHTAECECPVEAGQPDQ